MSKPTWPSGLPSNFGGLDDEHASWERARVAVLPVPYDFSTSYQSGTRWGPRAILEASRNMELWDDELGATYQAGIHTLPEVEPTALGPEAMTDRVAEAVGWILDAGKLPVMLGGEHSISAGAVRAVHERHPRLSVLQLDAHADMRNQYLDSPYSHACVMRRIRERVPAASVGIRSLSEEEAAYLRGHPAPMWSTRQFRSLEGRWEPILKALTDEVYVTFDLDAIDPSALPATGTPEPGGLDWYEAVDLLAFVAEHRRIVGLDVVELAPIGGQFASDFLAARLTYRLMGLALRRAPRRVAGPLKHPVEETRGPEGPAATSGGLVLRKNQDRRVRSGHPWIFSNEVGEVQGAPRDGGLVDVRDYRGAFLGRAYYNHASLICARILTRGRDEIDAGFFARRVDRALRLRERLLPGESAMRLVYGEADQLPGLVVDRYGEWLSVQILTLGMEVRAELIRGALAALPGVRGAVRVADSPLRQLEGLPIAREVWWGDVPERIELEVDGFQVEADLVHGQKTGLFLDQRLNRRRAAQWAPGRRALDLFSYQGEWALHLARAGATDVHAVDSSEPALAAGRRNAERNGVADRIRFECGDVFNTLRALERARERYGLVVLDPPALIKSRRNLAAGARAYRELNRAAMSLLDEDGILVTCSCSHHLDDMLFRQVLLEAARSARRPFRVLEWAGEPPDHPQLLAVPETHYLKCAVLNAV